VSEINLTINVQLRDMIASDLPTIFEYESDPDACYMAAFASPEPTNRAAFDAHWSKILADESITKRTIVYDVQVAGHIGCFEMFDQLSVGYWIGKPFWGKGIATRALQLFLAQVTTRPLYARAAKDNIGSMRVLEKCGFIITGEDKGYAAARDAEIEEYILTLEG
jgi:RimJ/RimL family protein N-acetyltransferase